MSWQLASVKFIHDGTAARAPRPVKAQSVAPMQRAMSSPCLPEIAPGLVLGSEGGNKKLPSGVLLASTVPVRKQSGLA